MKKISKLIIFIFTIVLATTSMGFAKYTKTIEAEDIVKDLHGNKIINIKDSIVVGDLYFTDSMNPEHTKDSKGNDIYLTTIKSKISFSNVLFKDIVRTSGDFEDEYSVFKNSVSFSNCVFEAEASFGQTFYKSNFILIDSVFKEDAYFDNIKFDGHIDISGTKVKNTPLKFEMIKEIKAKNIISKIKDGKDVELNHAIIHGDIDFTSLKNTDINSKIVIKNSTINGKIISAKKSNGQKITFKKEVVLDGNYFEEEVSLKGSVFLKKFSLKNGRFSSKINLDNSVFYENADIQSNSYLGDGIITNTARFLRGINSRLTQSSIAVNRRIGGARGGSSSSNINYTETTSSKLAEDITRNSKEYFEHTIVKGDFDLSTISKSNKQLLFQNVTFKGKVYFSESSSSKTFKSLLIFDSCKFEGEVLLDGVTFEREVSFIKSKFTKKASFNNTVFKLTAIFDGVVFSSNPNFNGATCKNGLSFNYTMLNNKEYKP